MWPNILARRRQGAPRGAQETDESRQGRPQGTKYDWLSNPKNIDPQTEQRFKALRDSTLKTARAWAIKELAMSLWGYVSKTWARKGWARWLSWAVRCRLEPMKKVAKTIKKHLWVS